MFFAFVWLCVASLIAAEVDDTLELQQIKDSRSGFPPADSNEPICVAPIVCVPTSECSGPGIRCDDGRVCCPPEQIVIPMDMENPDDEEAEHVEARSASGQPYQSSFGQEPRNFPGPVPAQAQRNDDRSNFNEPNFASSQRGNFDNFQQTFDPRDPGSESFSPRGPSSLGYSPNGPPTGNFDPRNLGSPDFDPNPLPGNFGQRGSPANSFNPNGAGAPFNQRRDFERTQTSQFDSNEFENSRQRNFGRDGSPRVRRPDHRSGHPGYETGVSNHYGSFRHNFGGQLGYFAPDFYGSGLDLYGLSYEARDTLHRYRYKEECGEKRTEIFKFHGSHQYPYAGPTPYDPVPYGPSYQKLGEYPWQAAVLGWSPEGYGLRCSATLINPYLLLTSAHCLRYIIEPELKVVLGVIDLLATDFLFPPIEKPVDRIFVHEKYDPDTLSHDIALLQLAADVNFHFTPHIGPACLPKINQTFVASTCYIVGWSDPNPYSGPVPHTNEIKVSDMKFIASREDCQQQVALHARHLNPSQLTEEMHCITGVSESSCLGSSGGSLFCDVESISSEDTHGISQKRTYLAGIVSWSNGQCGSKGLAVITELSPYVPWIRDLLEHAGGLDHFDPDYYGGLHTHGLYGGNYGHGNHGGNYGHHGHGAHGGYGVNGHRHIGYGHGNYHYGSSPYGHRGYGYGHGRVGFYGGHEHGHGHRGHSYGHRRFGYGQSYGHNSYGYGGRTGYSSRTY